MSTRVAKAHRQLTRFCIAITSTSNHLFIQIFSIPTIKGNAVLRRLCVQKNARRAFSLFYKLTRTTKKTTRKNPHRFFYHAAPFFAYICKVKNERPPINNNSFAINYVVNKNLLFKIYIIYE